MRHKIILLLVVFLIPWTLYPIPFCYPAEVKISDLPDGDASIASTDEVPANQSGTTRKLSIGGISDYITTDLNVAFGNPAVNGYCLKSTTLGVRSWGACVTTESDPIIDSITANYLCRGNGAGTLVICDREDNIEASIGEQITEHDDAGGAHATLLLSYATAAQLAAHDADPAPHAGVLVLAEDSVMTGTADAEVIMVDALFNRGFATGDCDDGTVTIDWNISNRYETLLIADCTVTFTSLTDGVGSFTWKIVQDAGGGNTITWAGTNIEWIDGSAPTLDETGDGVVFLSCVFDGTDYWCSATGNMVGAVTDDKVCQGDGAAVQCDLTQDGSGDCAAGSVCTGGHTHNAYATLNSPSLVTPDIGAATGTSLALTGNLTGLVSTTLDTAASVALNAADCAGSLRVNNDDDAIDYTLPGAAVGLSCCFYSLYAQIVTIDPVDGTDTIYLNGVSVGAGDAIDSAGGIGDFICLLALDGTRWVTLGRSGEWVDGGAD